MYYIVIFFFFIVFCFCNWGFMFVRDKLELFRILNVISFIIVRWIVFSLVGFIVNYLFN